jgi:hypothetical protein
MLETLPFNCRKNRKRPKHSIVPLLVPALFLIAQIFIGFHHLDTDHHSDQNGIPDAECSLCLVTAQHPVDLVKESVFLPPDQYFLENIIAPYHFGEAAAISTAHSPRAPPLVHC